MPVSGREMSSLDFANLIGGPLNAVVEAQAKSAISTTNFIKEVAFNEENEVVNVDFKYNKKNENGSDQQFTLTVPFLTMLPVPYISVREAKIDFNAKITSINESSTESNFSQQVDASIGGRYWFVSAKVNSKTSYQKQTSTSEKAERTFDMRVSVTAGNQEMPAGTERILTLLEEVITEKEGEVFTVAATVEKVDESDSTTVIVTNSPDLKHIKEKWVCNFDGNNFEVAANVTDNEIKFNNDASSMVGSTIQIKRPSATTN